MSDRQTYLALAKAIGVPVSVINEPHWKEVVDLFEELREQTQAACAMVLRAHIPTIFVTGEYEADTIRLHCSCGWKETDDDGPTWEEHIAAIIPDFAKHDWVRAGAKL